jgi:ATP-binding protein involved in chromosome partitioning
MGVHFLAELPLDPRVRHGGDHGVPIALGSGTDQAAAIYVEMARRTAERLEQAGEVKAPTFEISE